MSYNRFNDSVELINGDFAAKIGRGMISCDLMDKEFNCYLLSKVNGKCVYKSKFQKKYSIYEVKCYTCENICIGNTQQKLKKIVDGRLYNFLCLLKNRQKYD